MQNHVTALGGLIAFFSLGLSAFAVLANPGSGSLVVTDQPEKPSLMIQEVRGDNAGATHVPVRVRLSIPDVASADENAFRWGKLTAYLTTTEAADGPRIREATVEIGPKWANRSIFMEIPSPGEGSYFVHVEGEFYLKGQGDPLELVSASPHSTTFGLTEKCESIQRIVLPTIGSSECPLLFDEQKRDLTRGNQKHKPVNDRVLGELVQVITDLCEEGSLHRVSVQGWASVVPSIDPTNEELARERARSVVIALRSAVPKCDTKIRNDSLQGTQGATNQFGNGDPGANQCAQVKITRYSCK